MYRNRLTLIFCAVLIAAIALPGQMPVRAANANPGVSFSGPARLLQQLDTETPTPTETETPTASPTETITVTPTETPTETETPSVTDTATPTETQTETVTVTATETATESLTETMTVTATETATEVATETATPTATQTATPTNTVTKTPTITSTSTRTATATRTATPATSNRYVATNGVNTGNCDRPIAPCISINYALSRAFSGNTIYVAQGTYTGTGTEVVLINKSITLSGGWNATFTGRTGLSIIDGQAVRRGITNTANPVVIDRFQIQHGNSSYGAGIYNNHGGLTVNNSTISNNTSLNSGGGIYNLYGTLTITNSTLSGNLASLTNSIRGIAIYTVGSVTVILNNSTVSNNTVGNYSIYNAGSNLKINNSTISGNTGSIASGGQTSIQNSILAGNWTISTKECAGNITSAGYNIVGNIGLCGYTEGIGDQIGTVNAGLGPLQNNGGLTFTQALLTSSIARNAGNPSPSGSVSGACLATDQRGIIRAGNDRCDIGAFEANIPQVISSKTVSSSTTNLSVVAFKVIFSEPVTGVDKTDFALAASGLTNAAVISVTGSGKQYQVNVNTGQGNGTIRLRMIDNDSIKDGNGNPLGGIGTGNYPIGDAYTISNTRISFLNRTDANPTGALTLHYTLQFAENVTGVNTTAPFSDFALVTTGITGASIVSVSGSGTTYTITVNRGSGDGSLQLKVVDDDTIKDSSGTPLGGAGIGNGNYAGQIYSINTIPTPVSPAGQFFSATATFQWSPIVTATQYEFQVLNGATLVYTQAVNASACDFVVNCSYGSTTPLVPGLYQWNVRAFVNGTWSNYSASMAFEVLGARPGYWDGDTSFYVTSDSANVVYYTVYFNVPGCGLYNQWITLNAYVPITNYQIAYSSDLYFAGAFTSPTLFTGYAGMNSYYIPNCGYVSGGWPVTDQWQSFKKPSATNPEGFKPAVINLTLDAPKALP